MTNFDDIINNVIDDSVESLFGSSSKTESYMTYQGVKSALNSVSLSSTLDSITSNVASLNPKDMQSICTTQASTMTSNVINCLGNNALFVHTVHSGAYNWTYKLQGCLTVNGTFVDLYDNISGTMTLMSYQTNSSKGWIWRGVLPFVKLVLTEDADGGNVTVNVQPCIV